MIKLLLILLLLFQPPPETALRLGMLTPADALQRGQAFSVYTAIYVTEPQTITVTLDLPPGITGPTTQTAYATPEQPASLRWSLQVASDAPPGKVPIVARAGDQVMQRRIAICCPSPLWAHVYLPRVTTP